MEFILLSQVSVEKCKIKETCEVGDLSVLYYNSQNIVLLVLLLGHTNSSTLATSGLGVLTAHTQTVKKKKRRNIFILGLSNSVLPFNLFPLHEKK